LSRFATGFQKNAIPKPTIFYTPLLFITIKMKRGFTKLSICDTYSGQSPAELIVIPTTVGTPVESPAEFEGIPTTVGMPMEGEKQPLFVRFPHRFPKFP
jgi:hypothetical protein